MTATAAPPARGEGLRTARRFETRAGRELCVGAARALLEEVAEATPPDELDDARLCEVQRVVVVASSSRGGSSLLYHLLADRPDTLSIGGEHTALYKLNGLDRRGSDGSDGFDPDRIYDPKRLARDFLDWLGIGVTHQPEHLAGYPLQVARRLALQWPLQRIGFDAARAAAATAVAEHGRAASPHLLLRGVVTTLSRWYQGIDIDRYDLPGRARGERVVGPPNPFYCVEEPPFVVPVARRRPLRAELATMPLVLKSSVDAYRLPFLRSVFPAAELRLIHLTRNPAASINGLIDGWRDPGFYSYDVSDRATLNIEGYSEYGEHARRWWNFDVFPNWERYVDAPLPEVCAQQWRAAHAGILADAPSSVDATLTVKFEDLLDPATQLATLGRIHGFAGLPARVLERLPVVMPTAPPRPGRWRDRATEVLSAALQPDVLDVAAELGYRKEHSAWQ